MNRREYAEKCGVYVPSEIHTVRMLKEAWSGSADVKCCRGITIYGYDSVRRVFTYCVYVVCDHACKFFNASIVYHPRFDDNGFNLRYCTGSNGANK